MEMDNAANIQDNDAGCFRTAWLAITYKCNSRCIWCYSESPSNHSKEKVMEYDMFNQAKNLLKELKVPRITLIGGEPTVYPQLESMVASLKKDGFYIGMVSNGRLFSNKRFASKIINAGLDSLSISIEGSNAQMHDQITQVPGSFEQSIRGIKNCQDLGLMVSTESTASYVNQKDLNNLVDLLHSKDVSSASFNICGPCLSASHPYTVHPKDSAGMFTEIYKRSKEKGLRVTFVTPQPLCNFDPEIADSLIDEKIINTHCFVYYGKSFVLDYNGDVNPCVHYSGFPFFNIQKDDNSFLNKEEFLNRFWNKEGNAQKFRDKLWNYPSTKCINDPNYGKTCLGGCPLFWFEYDPEKEIKGMPENSTKLFGGKNETV